MDGSVEGIKKLVQENDVVLFMKGTPEGPMCGFSARAVGILKHVGLKDYASVDVFQEHDARQNVKVFTDWPTIPQFFVKGEFIGGVDIMMEMYQSGELQALFSDKGISLDV